MPAKWQQWMPFRIDAFKSSPAVAAMHPAARAGYLYLLTYQWQTDDCTIPEDPFELAEISGLGDELWAQHGARIVRKFETVTVEKSTVTVRRLSNIQLLEDWTEAKRVYEARRKSAETTNTGRSPSSTSTVTDQGPSRSADTRAHVRALVPVNVPVLVSAPFLGAFGSELPAANWLLDELGVPGDNALRRIVAECIRLLAKEGGDVETAAKFILDAGQKAQQRGEVIARFWFTDRAYLPKIAGAQKETDRERRRREFMERPTDDGS